VRLAVVAERYRGTSWAEIGEALGVTRQAAHERYADAEREVREALLFPGRDGEEPGALGWWASPDGLAHPEETARDLDEWERRHREPTDPDRGDRAVSAGLKPRTVTDEIGTVLALSKLLREAHDQRAFGGQEQPECLPRGVSYGRLERELYERKVASTSACSPRATRIPRSAPCSPRRARGWPS
jgi:hypothetical protein